MHLQILLCRNRFPLLSNGWLKRVIGLPKISLKKDQCSYKKCNSGFWFPGLSQTKPGLCFRSFILLADILNSVWENLTHTEVTTKRCAIHLRRNENWFLHCLHCNSYIWYSKSLFTTSRTKFQTHIWTWLLKKFKQFCFPYIYYDTCTFLDSNTKFHEPTDTYLSELHMDWFNTTLSPPSLTQQLFPAHFLQPFRCLTAATSALQTRSGSSGDHGQSIVTWAVPVATASSPQQPQMGELERGVEEWESWHLFVVVVSLFLSKKGKYRILVQKKIESGNHRIES